MKKVCKMCPGCDASTCNCPCHKMNECCKGKYYSHAHAGMHNGGSGAIYGLGMIGAAIYFISNTSGFWMIILAILKAIVWPVFMVFEAFKFLLG